MTSKSTCLIQQRNLLKFNVKVLETNTIATFVLLIEMSIINNLYFVTGKKAYVGISKRNITLEPFLLGLQK